MYKTCTLVFEQKCAPGVLVREIKDVDSVEAKGADTSRPHPHPPSLTQFLAPTVCVPSYTEIIVYGSNAVCDPIM